MQALIDHLRGLAEQRHGRGSDDPTDPRLGARADAMGALADLLEDEPELVRPSTRATIEARILPPLAEFECAVVGPRAAAVLAAHGHGTAVTTVDQLRTLDEVSVASTHEAWDMAGALGPELHAELADDLVGMLDLHRWEVDAAASGVDPGRAYFVRRPTLDEAGRRAWLEACTAGAGS